FLAQGVGGGINTVLPLVPQIGMMYLFLSFLEDSGYMARAAFVMDRLMQALGLPGKSFVPLIVGFGCNVPSIMGARTLDAQRERLITIMMAPFMSCGARLAIFAVFAAAFFGQDGASIVFSLYLLGIAVAILTGLVL
ncbi:nucleoside recognition domain-containing protein, partial [Yersinia pestis]